MALLLSSGVASLPASRPALASSGVDSSARASAVALVKKGNAHFDAKRYREALSCYRDAERLFPSKKIEFNLAEAYRQLGNLATAELLYEGFVDSADTASVGRFQRGAHSRLEEMRQKGGRIALSGAPEDALVAIDGAEAIAIPAHPLLALPGQHRLQILRAGRDPLEVSVVVKRGETETVEIDGEEQAAHPSPAHDRPLVAPEPVLEAAPGPKAASPLANTSVETSTDEDAAVFERWWFWAGVSAFVLAGTAAAIALHARGGSVDPPGELGASRLSSWQHY
jgi:tetratricopeptide repeat protein